MSLNDLFQSCESNSGGISNHNELVKYGERRKRRRIEPIAPTNDYIQKKCPRKSRARRSFRKKTNNFARNVLYTTEFSGFDGHRIDRNGEQ